MLSLTSRIPYNVRTNLASLVDEFRAHANETAVVQHRGVRRYATSYGDLAQLAGRFAAELQSRGIAPGERVVLLGENSAEWIAAFFGCLLRGVLAVPLDAAGSVDFIHRVLADVSPRLIIGDASLLNALNTDLPCIPFSDMTAVLPPTPLFTIEPLVTEDSAFQIIFTSGTSAEPKGIVHTHRNVLASLRPIETEIAKYRKYERWVHPLRFLHTLPLSHVFGQFMGLWTPAILAAELHFADRLEPARSIDLLRRERISVLVAVPRVLELLRAHLAHRFPSLEQQLAAVADLKAAQRWWRFRTVHRTLGWKFWAVISGGATLPIELERFWNRLGLALIQGYGMTETTALVTLNHPFRIGHGTIGKALPGREVKLSDTGEILVRGETVSTGIWQQGRVQQRGDEWLATGDLAEQNESGEFRFVARSGDAIVTASGLNIYPSDIEAVMLRQPGIRGCVVVPCQTSRGVEPVSVVLFAGDESALQQAIQNANHDLAEYQRIRRILRWTEMAFPYTSSGKLLRRRVHEWACATIDGNNAGESLHGDALLSMIVTITGVNLSTAQNCVANNEDLRLSEDLYLDSLGRVQLVSEIEQRMGVELGDEEMVSISTLGELRRALRNHQLSESAHVPTTKTPAKPGRTSNSAPGQQPTDINIYPHWPWTWPVRLLRIAVLETIVRPLVALLLTPRVEHCAVPLPRGPMLLVCNHVTMLDAALVLYALPPTLRHKITIAMSGEVLHDLRIGRNQDSALGNLFAPAGYWLLTALFNVFPLPRLQGFRRSFAHAGETLDHGDSVLIFPEGRRSHGAAMAPFRPGIGLLAAQSRVAVLPIALTGCEVLNPEQRRWFRSGQITVHIGEPIALSSDAQPTDWTAALEESVRALLI